MAALIGAAWLAAGAAFAADQPAPANVTIDYGALDRLGSGGSDPAPLPAPAEKPVSHIITPGYSGSSTMLGGPTPPNRIPDATALAAPTTPIESTTLDGTLPAAAGPVDLPGEFSVGGATGLRTTPALPSAAAPAAPAASQSASIDPAAGTTASGDDDQEVQLVEGQLRLPYEPGARTPPEAERGKIDALIERLRENPNLRLQVLAYAAGDSDEVMRARGLSLERALALRRYLMEHGIGLSRMDVRALGNTAQEEPADRVDLIPVPQ